MLLLLLLLTAVNAMRHMRVYCVVVENSLTDKMLQYTVKRLTVYCTAYSNRIFISYSFHKCNA